VTALIVVNDELVFSLESLGLVRQGAALLSLNQVQQDLMGQDFQLEGIALIDAAAPDAQVPERVLALQENKVDFLLRRAATLRVDQEPLEGQRLCVKHLGQMVAQVTDVLFL